MDFLQLAKERYSVRDFLKKIVPDEIVSKIVEAGYVAPTACNKQPLRITVVKSEEGLERFRKCTECHYDASLAFIVSYDKDMDWIRPYDGRNSGDIDASIVATHMMLEAASLGIGATWVMHFIPEAIKVEFEFPDNLEPVVVLPMGYPSEEASPGKLHSKYRNYNDVIDIV